MPRGALYRTFRMTRPLAAGAQRHVQAARRVRLRGSAVARRVPRATAAPHAQTRPCLIRSPFVPHAGRSSVFSLIARSLLELTAAPATSPSEALIAAARVPTASVRRAALQTAASTDNAPPPEQLRAPGAAMLECKLLNVSICATSEGLVRPPLRRAAHAQRNAPSRPRCISHGRAGGG